MTPADLLIRQANDYHRAGRFADAERGYRNALARFPNHPAALYLLGVLAGQVGNVKAAIDLIQRAISIEPNYVEALVDLGVFLTSAGRELEAITMLDRAISLKPDLAQAHNNRGNALKQMGRLEEAVTAFNIATRFSPSSVQALNNRGNALLDLSLVEEAITSFEAARKLDPQSPIPHSNLCNALGKGGRFEAALASGRRAIELSPAFVNAHNSLGVVLHQMGDYPAARASLARAIELQPDHADAHWNLALMNLRDGDYAGGWPQYEWRWRVPSLKMRRRFVQPQWDGSPLGRRTILLHAEQGFGDTIQFIRYLPLVVAMGGNVVVECPVELVPLIQSIHPSVVAKGRPLPAFDMHCPLLGLPMRLGTTAPDRIPPPISFPADDLRDREWSTRLGPRNGRLRVGLAWAGRADHANDQNRSIPLAAICDLANIPGIEWHSLQKGIAAPSGVEFPGLSEHSDKLVDFAETAALIRQLDLVVSVDTAVAHLAATLGRPTWILLPFVPDWRWLRDRHDSPWYPSVQLFRQERLGNWDGVIQEVSNLCREASSGGLDNLSRSKW